MKKNLRTAAVLAGIYQLVILVHIGLIFFFPAVNPSFMISMEALYAIGWFGWFLYLDMQDEVKRTIPFAGGLAVGYGLIQLLPRILRRLDLPTNLYMALSLLVKAESAFFVMVLLILSAKHNLPYEGPEL